MKAIILILILLVSQQVNAIGFNRYYHIIHPSQNKITIQALANPNASNRAHVYSAKIQQIVSPYDLTPINVDKEQVQSILYTPARTIALPGKDVPFTFIYNGPHDNKERYYAITWSDNLVTAAKSHENTTAGTVTSSVSATTVLVVSPRKVNVNYDFSDGVFTNLGNATLDFFAVGKCEEDAEKTCQIARPIVPGQSLKLQSMNKNKSISMAYWAEEAKAVYIQ